MITTVAGGGTGSDGVPAVNTSLGFPQHVAVDSAGNLFIVEPSSHTIRRVDSKTGIITTVAGTGRAGFNGDGRGIVAALNSPRSVGVDGAGNLLISDSDNNRLRLVVNPVVPFANVSPSSVSFRGEPLGSTGPTQTATLVNVGSATLSINSITIAGVQSSDFAQTNDCGTTILVGGQCLISFTFTPSASGNRSASLAIADNAAGSPQLTALAGVGTDFSINVASGTNCPSGGNCSTVAAIRAGQTANYDLQVSAISEFTGTVSLTCSGAPVTSTCSISSTSVPAGTSFRVSVSNTAAAHLLWPAAPNLPLTLLGCCTLGLLVTLSLLLAVKTPSGRYRIRRWGSAFTVLMVCTIIPALSGCGGGGTGGSGARTVLPPTNATLVVTGTSGNLQRSLNLSLTINH